MIDTKMQNKYCFKFYALVFGVILVIFPMRAVTANPVIIATTQSNLDLYYVNGKLSGKTTNNSLKDIFYKLAKLSGFRFTFLNNVDSQWKVTKTFVSTNIKDVIKDVLTGFSYALINTKQGYEVIVLSNPPGAFSSILLGIDKTSTQPITDNIDQKTLMSLEEYRPLPYPQAMMEMPGNKVETAFVARDNNGYYEAILQRADDALNSPHENLYSEAISQLAVLSDPAAGDILAEWITNNKNNQSGLRFQALSALIQFSKNSHYSNTQHIHLLESLTKDNDKNISNRAEQTLIEIQNSIYQNG